MRHFFLCQLAVLTLLAAALAAQAQSANPALWCPPGATWVYGYSNTYPQTRGTVTMRYARDTVVAGQPAQLLTRLMNLAFYNGPNPMPYPIPPHYDVSLVTRVVGSRVEILSNGQFYTLYDFGAVPGDSWLTPGVYCSPNLVRVTVDSVGRQQVGGYSLRWLRVRLARVSGSQSAGSWPGRIYEQVGSVSYVQPLAKEVCSLAEAPHTGPMQSYTAIGQPRWGYSFASSSLAVLAAEERATRAGFTAYPNPSTGLLRLSLPPFARSGGRLQLLDIAGRVVLEQPIPASLTLDIRALPAGTYSLLLQVPGEPALRRRLVRQ